VNGVAAYRCVIKNRASLAALVTQCEYVSFGTKREVTPRHRPRPLLAPLRDWCVAPAVRSACCCGEALHDQADADCADQPAHDS